MSAVPLRMCCDRSWRQLSMRCGASLSITVVFGPVGKCPVLGRSRCLFGVRRYSLITPLTGHDQPSLPTPSTTARHRPRTRSLRSYHPRCRKRATTARASVLGLIGSTLAAVRLPVNLVPHSLQLATSARHAARSCSARNARTQKHPVDKPAEASEATNAGSRPVRIGPGNPTPSAATLGKIPSFEGGPRPTRSLS
jgi:hypothetical protein